jgi:hypothetical protein
MFEILVLLRPQVTGYWNREKFFKFFFKKDPILKKEKKIYTNKLDTIWVIETKTMNQGFRFNNPCALI